MNFITNKSNLYRKVNRIRGKKNAIGIHKMDITVVTPVRNDPELINAMRSVPIGVDYIVALTEAPFWIVKIVENFRATHRPDMIVLRLPISGMPVGLNEGVKAAKTQKIVVLDSDCTLSSSTILSYSKALDKYTFVRGVTKVRQGGWWSSFSRLGQEELNRRFAEEARLIGPSIAFLKEDFLKLGGYDTKFSGSCDHEFALRIEDAGFKTGFASDSVIHHVPITFAIDWKAHLGYGRGMKKIDRKRGGFYGLGVCLDRWNPKTVLNKVSSRGLPSLIRTILMGTAMILGYLYEALCRIKTK